MNIIPNTHILILQFRQTDRMQEIFAQQYLGNKLNTQIIQVKHVLHRTPHSVSYHAVTTYGDMALVIQNYPRHIAYKQSSTDSKPVDTLSFLKNRNKLIEQNPSCFPLIYEQHIHVNHPQQILCITLMECFLPLCNLYQYFQTKKNRSVGQNSEQRQSVFEREREEISELYKKQGLEYEVENVKNFSKLVLGSQKLNKKNLTISIDNNKNMEKCLIYFLYSREIFFDFTQIRFYQQKAQSMVGQDGNKVQNTHQHLFGIVKQLIIKLLQRKLEISANANRIKEILFIKDRIYRFDPSFLNKAEDFYELSFYLNVHRDDQEIDVEVVLNYHNNTEDKPAFMSKIREMKVKQLEGNPKIIVQCGDGKRKQYNRLFFLDGKCTNSLVQLFYEQLAQKFIIPNSQYKLKKYEMITVEIINQRSLQIHDSHIDVKQTLLQKIRSQEEVQKQKKMQNIKLNSQKFDKDEKENNEGYQDYLKVFPSVTKYEVINFLIAYIKCIQPTIHSIIYHAASNSLHLQFHNRHGQDRSITLVFCDQYTIREEEISIIIEKARIRQCKVDIRMMQINDAFLMFLANSEKLKRINQLYISDCHGMTDGGINVLLVSPFCKNLKTLSLTSGSHLFDSAIESIGLKSELQKLELIACDSEQFGKVQMMDVNQNNPIDLSKMKLAELFSMGININISSLSHTPLRIIKINQQVPVEELKHFRNLALTQLKIKLIEGSRSGKSLMDNFPFSFSNPLSSKSAAVKQFAEGASANTLKILDLAQSSIKFKIIKQLFWMNELQKLVLNGCKNFGNQIQPISPKILNLSLINLSINIDQLGVLLQKTSILVHLNVIGTKIGKKDLLNFISSKRKYINNLKISQEQYSNKLLQYPTGNSPVKIPNQKGKPFPPNSQSRSMSPQKRQQQQVFDYIENIEILINKLLQNQQQNQFHYLLYKTEKSYKTLRMVISSQQGLTGNSSYDELYKLHHEEELSEKKQLLMDKLNKYLVMAPENLNSLRNLYIEDMRLEDLCLIQATSEKQQTDYLLTLSSNNVILSAHSSKFIISPKIIINKKGQPINFKILPTQTIDRITHRFVKFIKNCPDHHSLISIDFSQNKLIGSSVIKMLRNFAQDRIQDIDFRGCMFGYEQISQDIFDFTFLNQLNGSQYLIHLNKQNFIKQSQKCLKFFMKIKPIKTLKIQCEETEEIQILYSVLYHILEQHQKSITKLSIKLDKLVLNFQSELFLTKIFQMQQLQQLEFVIRDCIFRDSKDRIGQILRQSLGFLQENLISLTLVMPSSYLPHLRVRNVQNLIVEFSDNQIQQSHLQKCLKHLTYCHRLKHLKIMTPNCLYISNLAKVFSPIGISSAVRSSFLQKIDSLETLYLNFQYCPLKEQTIFQLIEGLAKCPNLKFFEINVSFSVSNLNQLLSAVQTFLENANRTVCLRIICVTENSNKFVFNRQEMHQRGAEFIL